MGGRWPEVGAEIEGEGRRGLRGFVKGCGVGLRRVRRVGRLGERVAGGTVVVVRVVVVRAVGQVCSVAGIVKGWVRDLEHISQPISEPVSRPGDGGPSTVRRHARWL